jgi:S-adenosylmethionine:tRNA-ribosyltransferase-isomerase (queuine synthetase)
MPYKDIDDGHRIGLTEDVMPYAKQVFEQGLQLEAILLAHEYLEQRINAFFTQVAPSEPRTIHRKFKQLIDLLRSEEVLAEEDYEVLNEFNRLRNVNSNQILNFSLTLRGAKKGDMIKAMDLAEESERVISRLSQEFEESRKSRKGKKKR